MTLAQRGLTNDQIAHLVGTRPATVRNQLSSAYTKLGVSNRTQLAFLLAQQGDTSPTPRDAPRSAIEKLLADAQAHSGELSPSSAGSGE